MFGFGNDDKKKAEQREPYWVAPTTGNVYWKRSEVPEFVYGGGDIGITKTGDGDDALDGLIPLHGKQQKEMSQDIKELKKMMSALIERQNSMEQMIASLLRHQYDQIHQQDQMNEQLNEQQR